MASKTGHADMNVWKRNYWVDLDKIPCRCKYPPWNHQSKFSVTIICTTGKVTIKFLHFSIDFYHHSHINAGSKLRNEQKYEPVYECRLTANGAWRNDWLQQWHRLRVMAHPVIISNCWTTKSSTSKPPCKKTMTEDNSMRVTSTITRSSFDDNTTAACVPRCNSSPTRSVGAWCTVILHVANIWKEMFRNRGAALCTEGRHVLRKCGKQMLLDSHCSTLTNNRSTVTSTDCRWNQWNCITCR